MNININNLISLALAEDLSPIGDITSDLLIDSDASNTYTLASRNQAGILSGINFAEAVYKNIDSNIKITWHLLTGQAFTANQVLATIAGNTRSILAGERIFLNLLQKAISIATYTKQFVEIIQNTNVKILDTRKTTPLWRDLERQAVLDGDGYNHRYNLSTGILIKDNHIAHCSGINQTLNKLSQQKLPYLTKIEIEIDNITQLQELLDHEHKHLIQHIMLDNFAPEQIREALKLIKNSSQNFTIEASGGINMNNIKGYIQAGIDYISIGSLTTAMPLIDIGLDFAILK